VAGRHRHVGGGPVRAAPGFADVLRVRPFAALLGSELVSQGGDQIARLALAVLVYDRSHSPALTAATFAVTYLPWLLAGPLLSGLGDRFPRRTVLVTSDLLRVVLAGLLAVPGMPVWALLVLVFLLICGEAPFTSARAALLPEVLQGDAYVVGHSLQNALSPLVNVLGFAVGGILVAAVGPGPALLLDAASFLVSAVVLRAFLPRSPHPTLSAPPVAGEGRSRRPRTGWGVVVGNPQARWVLVFAASVLAFDTVGVALAVPWAAELGRGSTAAGLISAAGPVGAAVGGLVLARAVPADARVRLLPWLGLLTVAPQVLFLLHPGLAPLLVIMVVAGLGAGCQVVANQLFVLAVPAEHRSKAFGIAGAVLMVGQGSAILGAGLLAQTLRTSTVVGLAGVAGTGLVAALWASRPALGGLLTAAREPVAARDATTGQDPASDPRRDIPGQPGAPAGESARYPAPARG